MRLQTVGSFLHQSRSCGGSACVSLASVCACCASREDMPVATEPVCMLQGGEAGRSGAERAPPAHRLCAAQEEARSHSRRLTAGLHESSAACLGCDVGRCAEMNDCTEPEQ